MQKQVALLDGRCCYPQYMGCQEAWLESVVTSTTISQCGILFWQAFNLSYSDMSGAQRCGYNVV